MDNDGNLDIGAAISGGFNTWLPNVVRFVTLGLAVFVPLALVRVLLDAVLPSMLAFAPAQVVTAIGQALLGGMFIVAITDYVAGRPEKSISELVDAVKPRLIQLVVLGIIIGVGYLLCILPGIVLSFLAIFAPALIMLDEFDAVESIKGSYALMSGNELMVFVLWLVVGIGTAIIGGIVTIPLTAILVVGIGLPVWILVAIMTVLVGAVVTPIATCIVIDAYLQLRGEDGEGDGSIEPPLAPPAAPDAPHGPFS